MAVFGGAFAAAFQRNSFQFGAFQMVRAPNEGQNAGDTAYPAEIAYLERLRKIRKWQDERQHRLELRKRRELDAEIDRLLAECSGAEGERPDSEIPASQRAALAKAQSAVQPLKPFRPSAPIAPTLFGNQLRAAAAIARPLPERPGAAYVNARLAAYGADQASQRAIALAQFNALAGAPAKARQTALDQLLTLPAKPARMTPDQLLAALAQGNREMQRIRGY